MQNETINQTQLEPRHYTTIHQDPPKKEHKNELNPKPRTSEWRLTSEKHLSWGIKQKSDCKKKKSGWGQRKRDTITEEEREEAVMCSRLEQQSGLENWRGPSQFPRKTFQFQTLIRSWVWNCCICLLLHSYKEHLSCLKRRSLRSHMTHFKDSQGLKDCPELVLENTWKESAATTLTSASLVSTAPDVESLFSSFMKSYRHVSRFFQPIKQEAPSLPAI